MNTSDAYIAPFSGEVMSDKTMSEIKELRSSGTYAGYNPNTDTDARELGGDVQEVPVGNGFTPLVAIVMLYVLRKVIKMKISSKTM